MERCKKQKKLLSKDFGIYIIQDMFYLLESGTKHRDLIEDYLRNQEIILPGEKTMAHTVAKYLKENEIHFDPRENPNVTKSLIDCIEFDF